MSAYPEYVRCKLLEARDVGQWKAAQPDGAAICFDILADFPDCGEASELVYELFCDEWTIYDNRIALQRLIDEWDDQPHQQRRRLALSFRFMSRYDGWDEDDDIPPEGIQAAFDESETEETRQFLRDGKHQLIEAYCLGDEGATDYAWPRFMQAIAQANDPQRVRLLIAKQYADHGFFADAVELLLDSCAYGNTFETRRLLAEARWWHDNAHRVPWVPPPGDGSRYNRIIKLMDPEAPTMQETIERMRERVREAGNAPTWDPLLDSELLKEISEALSQEKEAPRPTLVDWSFLEQEDGTSTEIAPWVEKQIRLSGWEGKAYVDDIRRMHKFTRPIPPPKTPPRYDPRDVQMTNGEMDAEEEDEFWEELSDETDEMGEDE